MVGDPCSRDDCWWDVGFGNAVAVVIARNAGGAPVEGKNDAFPCCCCCLPLGLPREAWWQGMQGDPCDTKYWCEFRHNLCNSFGFLIPMKIKATTGHRTIIVTQSTNWQADSGKEGDTLTWTCVDTNSGESWSDYLPVGHVGGSQPRLTRKKVTRFLRTSSQAMMILLGSWGTKVAINIHYWGRTTMMGNGYSSAMQRILLRSLRTKNAQNCDLTLVIKKWLGRYTL